MLTRAVSMAEIQAQGGRLDAEQTREQLIAGLKRRAA